MSVELVTLVDEKDRPIGAEEKLKVHQEGMLHRAFSIFVFNGRDELLLQQRAPHKYHSGGLWTNTCCGHPRPEETVTEAAVRRLREEMGFICNLKKTFDFIYHAELDHGLCEHEFDHVYIGQYAGEVVPNPQEVADYRWLGVGDLKEEIRSFPERFTVWFKLVFERVVECGRSSRDAAES